MEFALIEFLFQL